LKKIALFLLFIAISLANISAETVTLDSKTGRSQKLLKEDSKQLTDVNSNSQTEVYYLYGIKKESTKLQSNGTIIVSFKEATDFEEFAEENNLEFERVINHRNSVVVFKNIDSSKDVVEKSNQLNQLAIVKNSTPNWKRYRALK